LAQIVANAPSKDSRFRLESWGFSIGKQSKPNTLKPAPTMVLVNGYADQTKIRQRFEQLLAIAA
ncbi:hypothetical protein, partial [Rhodopirellula bahusiensis]|uniref:hypothetical protein n=1 Tax=Rhodopirellula bahusiensis TaxID=2014065 RepID=UPI003265D172